MAFKSLKEKAVYFTKGFKQKQLQIIRNYKDFPCMDCGRVYPYYVMDFDHRDPKKKSFAIGRTASVATLKLLKEIAKCDLVCANCHRIRTFKRSKYGIRKRKTI